MNPKFVIRNPLIDREFVTEISNSNRSNSADQQKADSKPKAWDTFWPLGVVMVVLLPREDTAQWQRLTPGGDMTFGDLIADVNWTTGVALISAIMTNWLAWRRYQRMYRLEDKTDPVLLELLQSKKYDMRTFKEIQRRIPLEDEKLREALLRIGAVAFTQRGTKEELWGLLDKHRKKVFDPGSDNPE